MTRGGRASGLCRVLAVAVLGTSFGLVGCQTFAHDAHPEWTFEETDIERECVPRILSPRTPDERWICESTKAPLDAAALATLKRQPTTWTEIAQALEQGDALRPCYESQATNLANLSPVAEGSRLEGEFHFALRADGTVAKVDVVLLEHDEEFSDERVEGFTSCVRERLARIAFAPLRGGRLAHVEYPFRYARRVR